MATMNTIQVVAPLRAVRVAAGRPLRESGRRGMVIVGSPEAVFG
jgi:hypothetical protein